MAQGMGGKGGRKQRLYRPLSPSSSEQVHGLFHLTGEEPAVASLTQTLRKIGNFLLQDAADADLVRNVCWRNPVPGPTSEIVNVIDLDYVSEAVGPLRVVSMILYGENGFTREATLREPHLPVLTLTRIGQERDPVPDDAFMRRLSEDVARIVELIMPPTKGT